ncbi:hypothetical protein LRB11_14275, partial [Ectothiorhodospira haloalkaliphila]|uniref:hypothetical protein n=1 Tax=Ectothiorhodospira haloalkaliphila TaxID=421628 RepID=UPI001EE85952
MALVVVRLGDWFARVDRQAWLGAIQGLDLTFLVHRQHHGTVGWIHVEPHDVLDLVHEFRVRGQFEGLHKVWLESKSLPDPVHRRLRDARLGAHAPGAPVAGVL